MNRIQAVIHRFASSKEPGNLGKKDSPSSKRGPEATLNSLPRDHPLIARNVFAILWNHMAHKKYARSHATEMCCEEK